MTATGLICQRCGGATYKVGGTCVLCGHDAPAQRGTVEIGPEERTPFTRFPGVPLMSMFDRAWATYSHTWWGQ
jgi:hypothetical protein